MGSGLHRSRLLVLGRVYIYIYIPEANGSQSKPVSGPSPSQNHVYDSVHLGPDPLPAVRPLGGLYTFSFLALGGRNCEPAGPRRSAVRQHPQQHLAVFGGWPLNTYSAHYTNGACHVPHAAQDAARQSKLRALLRPLCTLVDASWRYKSSRSESFVQLPIAPYNTAAHPAAVRLQLPSNRKR